MKPNQKGSSNTFLILAIIVVLAAAGAYLLNSRTAPIPTATNNIPTNQAIQSSSGLDTASAELDTTDIDSLDTGMNQISSDTASF